MLASTPHFGIVGLKVEKDVPNLNDNRLQYATHTILVSFQDILGFTIHNPELIMLKKKKSYRDWSALKKVYHIEWKNNDNCISYKNTWNKSWSNPEK